MNLASGILRTAEGFADFFSKRAIANEATQCFQSLSLFDNRDPERDDMETLIPGHEYIKRVTMYFEEEII